MAYRVCWAVHHEKFTPLADQGVSHGEKTQASVKGSHWLALKGRKRLVTGPNETLVP